LELAGRPVRWLFAVWNPGTTTDDRAADDDRSGLRTASVDFLAVLLFGACPVDHDAARNTARYVGSVLARYQPVAGNTRSVQRNVVSAACRGPQLWRGG
jgi:hypothetical protein